MITAATYEKEIVLLSFFFSFFFESISICASLAPMALQKEQDLCGLKARSVLKRA